MAPRSDYGGGVRQTSGPFAGHYWGCCNEVWCCSCRCDERDAARVATTPRADEEERMSGLCWGERHIWSWGSSSTGSVVTDVPNRCNCGLVSRDDIDPIRKLEAERDAAMAEVERLKAVLAEIDPLVTRGMTHSHSARRIEYLERARTLTRDALAPAARSPEGAAACTCGLSGNTSTQHGAFCKQYGCLRAQPGEPGAHEGSAAAGEEQG